VITLDYIVKAAEHGAATVYHDIVAAEGDVSMWAADHPEVGPLVEAGTAYAMNFLRATGVPVPAIETAAGAVMAALKAMAANDGDVQSGGYGGRKEKEDEARMPPPEAVPVGPPSAPTVDEVPPAATAVPAADPPPAASEEPPAAPPT
jgi:hypothetical protein